MAPGEDREVEERKSRFREVLSVKAVRRDWICDADQPKELRGNLMHVRLLTLGHNMSSCSDLMSLGMNCISVGPCDHLKCGRRGICIIRTNASARLTKP